MKSINWPTEYLPGKTDNFVSNEVITSDLSIKDIWKNLVDTAQWPKYYDNAANIVPEIKDDTTLHFGEHFRFDTFGFPIDAQVMELVEPVTNSKEARIAWHGWQDGDKDTALDVYHAFLIEELPGNLVRILTQESQIGKPAAEMATQKPNPMLNGHQAWLDGLVEFSKKNNK